MNIIEKFDSYSKINPNSYAYCNYFALEDNYITYKELTEMSNNLAAYILENYPNNTSPIVVYGHKNCYMLVCFLACVKSGRPYCPVDISVPFERLNDIIFETNSPFIFATEELFIEDKNIIRLDEIKDIAKINREKPDSSFYVKGDEVYYIIFTSGSTGKPKGVQITENCLSNFLNWAITLGNKQLENQSLIFINQAPFSFDLSVMDLYMSLYLGGTLWALEKSIQANLNKLFSSLKLSNANVWVSTPSFADMCLADKNFNVELLPQVELFLFCGEVLTNNTVKNLHERFPKATVVNTYGPTESTVAITEVIVDRNINENICPLPVGKPKPGTFILITDSNGQILKDGQKGEIVIVGDSVSVGYFNRPDLTKEKFSTVFVEGNEYRSYKTGDEGYIKDGQLYYCGRIDLQIKLHGYRIEIEDIENNILKLDTIKNVVVVPVIKDGAVTSLSAYVVPNFKVEKKLESIQKLKKDLVKFLPQYMIPKSITFIESIPMTNNGKADRKKLMEDKA